MKAWLLLAVELLAVLVLLAGVAMVYQPAALILAGVLGVLACERIGATLGREPKKAAK